MDPRNNPTVAPIAVLGMHRSGTSCLTGLLEDAGVWLGEVSKDNPFNRKGNQESITVTQLHDQVLADNGATWDAPPTGDCIWRPERMDALNRIIDAYPAGRSWAVKDPRACFTITGWRAAVAGLQLIGTYRHPAAVAASLQKRGKALQVVDADGLWCRYNEQLLRLHERWGFPIVCFDLPPRPYLEQVRRAVERLGIVLAPTDAAFFEAGLRAESAIGFDGVSARAAGIYQRLNAVAC